MLAFSYNRTICMGIGTVVEALALLGRVADTGPREVVSQQRNAAVASISSTRTLKDGRRTVTKRPI
jgi:hypothetical protein